MVFFNAILFFVCRGSITLAEYIIVKLFAYPPAHRVVVDFDKLVVKHLLVDLELIRYAVDPHPEDQAYEQA